MRLQSIVNSNDSLQITYLDEADIHAGSGIMVAHTVDIPHPVLPQEILDEIVDSAKQVIEFARVTRREPEASFIAPR